MFNVKTYPAGTFSWADCTTTDPAAAKKFYNAVLGWDAVDVPAGDSMTYTMFKLNGNDVAGMGELQDEQKEQGVPPHWMSYITVDDVDAMAEKVKALGGKVILPPYQVMENGRMIIIQDTVGAQVALWQPGTHAGAGIINTYGAMIWNELQTTDAKKAIPFYKDLFGWKIEPDDTGDYYYISNNGRMNGGILPMDADEYAGIPAHWMIYFNVKDIDTAHKAVTSTGGETMMDINEAPGVGKFVMVKDPAGAMLTIMQSDNADSWSEPEETESSA
jgi:hypothetical protein